VPGSEEHVIESLFSNFLPSLGIECCLSGGFVLGVLIRANLETDAWMNTDLDFFVSDDWPLETTFLHELSTWANTIRHCFYEQREQPIRYRRQCYKFSCWAPYPTRHNYIRDVATWRIPCSNGKFRRIQFIFLNALQTTPTQFVSGMFDFTFLMNKITIEKNWRTPKVCIKYPGDILAKEGCYLIYFKSHWIRQWDCWQRQAKHAPSLSDQLKPASKDSKAQAAKMNDRRAKYETRGFLLYGAIPLGRFALSLKPFATNQRRRNDQPIGARKRKRDEIENCDDSHRESARKDLGHDCIGLALTSQRKRSKTVTFAPQQTPLHQET
jgi:hypothetical protein